MELLTTHELKEFLRLKSKAAAKKMATRLGVKPISYGSGRGLGDRWVREEVEKALLLLRDGIPKSQPEKKRKRRSTGHLFDGPCPFK